MKSNSLMYFLIFIFIFNFQSTAKSGGTVVGNGGDPIFEFLETTRNSMVETLKVIINDPAEQKIFCIQQPGLTTDQVLFCRDFFMSVAYDILRLSQGANKTLFVLRENPLLVKGPDGKPMIVTARTDLGPCGPIEFHRDSVKTMIPTQVLFLIAHEFQHKADFKGKNITDNEAIGPFATGRDLIDAVSKSVAVVARKKGKIGTQFGLKDIFDCLVTTNSSQFGARISSSRLFQSEDLMSYETSFGKNPTDGSVYLPENTNSSILLRFSIQEPNNCGDANPLRQTSVDIIRQLKLSDGSLQNTLLNSTLLTTNPMCSGQNKKIDISWDSVKFSCEYYGTEGSTSSFVKLNKKVP